MAINLKKIVALMFIFSTLVFSCGAVAGPVDNGDGADVSQFVGIWKPSSVQVSYMGEAGMDPTQNSAKLPAKLQDDLLGPNNFEQFVEILGDTINLYTYVAGDSVYYKYSLGFLCLGGTDTCGSFAGAPASVYGNFTINYFDTYQMNEGVLNRTMNFPGLVRKEDMPQFFNLIIYEAYKGKFPPSNWPTKQLELN